MGRHTPPGANDRTAQRLADLEAQVRTLQQMANSGYHEQWIVPTFQAGYSANTATGYFKDDKGFVHFRGRINVAASGGTAFILPVGYRPGAPGDLYACAAWTGSVPTYGFIDIDVEGKFSPYHIGATQVGLGNFSFYAEA
jgi:hypothetical protein